MKDLPIACSLSPADLQERKDTALRDLLKDVAEVEQRPEGYAFRFDASDGVLDRITSVVKQERTCCRFLRFELTVTPDEGPIWLAISGPEGTREFLLDLLDLESAP